MKLISSYRVTATFSRRPSILFARLTVWVGVTPWTNYILASSNACVRNALAVISFDIAPVNIRIPSKNYLWLIYFVIEMTRVPCRFRLKDFCKASPWECVVMWSLMTNKSSWGQTVQTMYVKTMFIRYSVKERGQLLRLKHLFHTGVVDSQFVQSFTTIVDYLYIYIYIYIYI